MLDYTDALRWGSVSALMTIDKDQMVICQLEAKVPKGKIVKDQE